MHNIEIKTLEKLTLATVDHKGDYTKINGAFEKIFTWNSEQEISYNSEPEIINKTTRYFAIFYDDPTTVSAENLRSQAGVSVDDAFTDNNIIKKTVLPSGKYAVLTHKGAYSELRKTYEWLYQTWLPNSKEESDDNKPVIEEYLNHPKQVPPNELLTTICIPLK